MHLIMRLFKCACLLTFVIQFADAPTWKSWWLPIWLLTSDAIFLADIMQNFTLTGLPFQVLKCFLIVRFFYEFKDFAGSQFEKKKYGGKLTRCCQNLLTSKSNFDLEVWCPFLVGYVSRFSKSLWKHFHFWGTSLDKWPGLMYHVPSV